MISKIFLNGKTFGETCQYLCQDQTRAEILYAEGVRSHDLQLMAADFEWQHRLMPEKEKPVFHGVLSFPPGEQVTDERLVEIGRKYLERIGIADTQYAFVKHTDKPHLHMHIIANKVDNDGDPTGKGLIIERGIKAAEQLTREYELRPEEGKSLEQTHRQALHQPDGIRYRIYEAIKEQLPLCNDLEDLEKGLLRQGITVRYREDAETGRKQGISFRLEQRSFKGGQVDKDYTLKGLEETLAFQQRLRQELELQEEIEWERVYVQRHGMRLSL
jgi:Relaxase/Mobilisation nuclease domain